MDLPADKAKILRQYDNERKWDLICDQVCGALTQSDLFENTMAFIVATIPLRFKL